mgnify:CR=1 FL=1|tara:strand:- start:935 stop:1369 length:435 start_codon:yes stop_codon:yes gene_type:complete
MAAWYEIASVFLTSAVKFFAGPILAKSFGFSYVQTILLTSIGGIFGVFLFFKIGSKLVHFFPNYFKPVTKKKKIFTKKNKFYVLLIRNYGMFGIALLSPILISIPVGSFLAARFFEGNAVMVRAILCMSVVFWSVTLSTFLFLF